VLYDEVLDGYVRGVAIKSRGVETSPVENGTLAGVGIVAAEKDIPYSRLDVAIEVPAQEVAARGKPIGGVWSQEPAGTQEVHVVAGGYDDGARWRRARTVQEGLTANNCWFGRLRSKAVS
jgi:hypothetical protein